MTSVNSCKKYKPQIAISPNGEKYIPPKEQLNWFRSDHPHGSIIFDALPPLIHRGDENTEDKIEIGVRCTVQDEMCHVLSQITFYSDCSYDDLLVQARHRALNLIGYDLPEEEEVKQEQVRLEDATTDITENELESFMASLRQNGRLTPEMEQEVSEYRGMKVAPREVYNYIVRRVNS